MIALIVLLAAQDRIDRRREALEEYLLTPEALFQHTCAPCHGDEGRGDGRFWTSDLTPRPADLTRLSGTDVEKCITQGSSAPGKSAFCPPWGRTIRKDRIETLAAFVRGLSAPEVPPAAPEETTRVNPRDPFPWALAAVIVAELLLLAWIFLRRRRSCPTEKSSSP